MGVPFGTVLSQNSVTTAVLVQEGPLIIAAVRAFISGLAADAYIQLFDAAAAADVTLGTTVPAWVVLVDFGTGNVSAGDGLPTHGLVFRNGLVVASTTDANNSTTVSTHVRVVII